MSFRNNGLDTQNIHCSKCSNFTWRCRVHGLIPSPQLLQFLLDALGALSALVVLLRYVGVAALFACRLRLWVKLVVVEGAALVRAFPLLAPALFLLLILVLRVLLLARRVERLAFLMPLHQVVAVQADLAVAAACRVRRVLPSTVAAFFLVLAATLAVTFPAFFWLLRFPAFFLTLAVLFFLLWFAEEPHFLKNHAESTQLTYFCNYVAETLITFSFGGCKK